MVKKHLCVASVTMRCDLDPQINRKKMVDMINAIKQAHPEVELILFGEAILGWYSKRGASKEYHRSIAEPIPGETTILMCGVAKENGIFLSFGMSELDEDSIYNTQVLIDPYGEISALHRKFNLMQSSAVFSPGWIPVTMTEINGIRTALIVCSDIQSPIVRKELTTKKPELILGGLANPEDPDWFVSGLIAKMFNAWIVTANHYGDEDVNFFEGDMVIGDPMGRLRVKTVGKEQYIYFPVCFDGDRSWFRRIIRRMVVILSFIPFLIIGMIKGMIRRIRKLAIWKVLNSKIYDPVTLEVKDIESDGLILDIGGGGEGVIGRLKGKQVVAIDIRKDELEETVDGPLKIVMDARNMTFLDGSFNTATAFFSMMYMKTREEHQKVMREAWRVLKPGGRLHLWDVDLSKHPAINKEFFLVRVRYRVGDYERATGYGSQWPNEHRGEEYYIQLAKEVGFQQFTTERLNHIFYLVFIKQCSGV